MIENMAASYQVRTKNRAAHGYGIIIACMLIAASLSAQDSDNSKILWSANWSTDGKYIAVGGVDKKIRLYNGKSFALIKVIDTDTEIQRMSWHPFANILAVAAVGNGSKIIDLDKQTEYKLEGDKGYGSRAIAWNYTGELLAVADYEGEITIRTPEGKLIRTITKSNTKGNVAIDWHPAKDEFIVLSEAVRIYDAEGVLLSEFKHRKQDVLLLCVKWHTNGGYFVLGDYGDNEQGYSPVLQYRMSDGTLIRELRFGTAEYRNISWSRNGKLLASASDKLRIWDRDGKLIAEGPPEDKLWGVDWSADGKFIITSSHEGHIKIWDAKAKFVRELTY